MDEQQKARDERRATRVANRIKAYKKVFGTVTGKKVLGDMMKAHGMLHSHPANAQQMALKEGERLVILRILQILDTNPAQLLERIADAQLDE